VHIAAIIKVGDLRRDCTVRDIADNGAQIAIDDSRDLPDEFLIRMASSGFPIRRCRLIWRTDFAIGVEFMAPSQDA
jgi:hypothetical protein